MNYKLLLEVVESEFNKDIAVLVVIAVAHNLSMKPKKSDLKISGQYTERLNRKTRRLMDELTNEEFNLVIDIRNAWHEYISRIEMKGIGGCTVKTLREIIQDSKNKACNNL